MTTAERSLPRKPDVAEGRGSLFFLETPVFEMDVWTDGDQVVVHVVDLDIVASGRTTQDAIDCAGAMIFELLEHLMEESEEGATTEAEEEQLNLLLARLGPPAIRQHRRDRLAAFWSRVARIIGRRPHDWEPGGRSTHSGSEQASHA